ncbi:hypothetical protein METHP14_110081 [Pseudomonas sp. P14-2025]
MEFRHDLKVALLIAKNLLSQDCTGCDIKSRGALQGARGQRQNAAYLPRRSKETQCPILSLRACVLRLKP